ncbi:YjfK family protein [Roseomonas sp. NAR14]|uniref:YjfK family protein n=1 Tax=Roseomonas acroporae TaxID=2937791 RepID=A0A9X1YC34_9PROT|nr:DUF2491 family protein [Roseomonas acroporae]MCK8783796.1 YjfK family protein [Roseomonas acroporae]
MRRPRGGTRCGLPGRAGLALALALGPAVQAATPVAASAMLGFGAVLAATGPAEAQRSRSSGGYSRSSGGGYGGSRTPSFGGSSGGYSRTPSMGGYTRSAPGGGYGGGYGGGFGGYAGSPGDRSVSRQSSGSALDSYRRSQQPANRTPDLSPSAPGGSQGGDVPWWRQGARTGPGGGGFGVPRGGGGGSWGGSWGRAAPVPRGNFGMWDAALLWFLFNSLSQPGHDRFFHDHADDPRLRDWRQEAERRAQTDPEIRARLDDLDRRLDGMATQPRDPDAPPPADAPRPAAPAGQGGGWVTPLVLAGGLGFLGFMWLRRRQADARGRGRSGSGTSGQGTSGGGDSGMGNSPIGTAAGILRQRMSGQGYTPRLFRVGQTVTLDPTPFLLLGGATHVPAPAAPSTSVERVSTLSSPLGDGRFALTRLYLPGGALLQLHLDAGGQPDECRYFAPLDEVTPQDNDEWGFWLDEREGAIGWPDFQTKDGKVYQRVWSPGPARVPPLVLDETLQGVEPERGGVPGQGGGATRRLTAMLYGAPTGAAPPAPQTEYMLVAVVEQGGEAHVEILAGIDVNPASLSLA